MKRVWPTKLVDLAYRRAFRIAYPLVMFTRRYYRADGVVMAVWANGRLLVVRHSYKPGLGIPGGGKRRHEDPAAAALRELGEEVGQPLHDAVKQAGMRLLMSRQYTRNRGTNYFLEAQIPFEPELIIDRREIIHAEFVAPSHFKRSECDRYFAAYLDLMERTHKIAA